MHDKRRGGHGVWPFLLIPAAVMTAKAMRRHRMAHGWVGSEAIGRHGHRGWAGSVGPDGEPGFRLPPKIEAVLDSWHTKAHQAAPSADTEPGSGEAPTA
jgi:hypothetical protein